MIYLDHASTTYIYPEILERINYILKNMWGNPSNLYTFGRQSKTLVEESREKIANALGVEPCEIFFTSGASEGNTWAIHQKSKCCCSQYEHHDITNNVASFIVDEFYLDKILYQKHKMINVLNYNNFLYSHMFVQNETGEIFNIQEMADKAHEIGMIMHSDMTQALGNVPINLKDTHVDIASFSAHKIHCPKMVGFNYFNKETFNEKNPIRPLIYGGGQEYNMRGGTENVPYVAILGDAVEKAVENVEKKHETCLYLKKFFLEAMAQTNVPFIIVSPANSVPSTIAICVKDIESEILADMLSEQEIFVSTGSACTSGNMENDMVLEAMEIPDEYIHGLIRISTDPSTNTYPEMVQAAKAIEESYNKLVG